jgi:hypothetical protein
LGRQHRTIDRKLRQLLDSGRPDAHRALGRSSTHEHEAIAQEDRPGVPEGLSSPSCRRATASGSRLRPAMVAVARDPTTTEEHSPTDDKHSTTNPGGIN